MKKNKVTIKTGRSDEFFRRVRGRAEKLDRGESLPAEITISFEDPMELLNILTSERVRLLVSEIESLFEHLDHSILSQAH